MMRKEERDSLVRLYENRFATLGDDIRTLGWNTREDQRLRFKVLSDIGDLTGARICDIGCGFGDLFGYLRGRFAGVKYTGIDIVPSLIERARELHPEGTFRCADILEDGLSERFDFILLSGALNYRVENNPKLTREMVSLMFAQSDRGVGVNFLSSYVNYWKDHNFHHVPEAMFSFAKTLTRWVSLRHDYPLWEFTLFLYKDPQPSSLTEI